VNPTPGLDGFGEAKYSCPWQESKDGTSIVLALSLVIIPTTLTNQLTTKQKFPSTELHTNSDQSVYPSSVSRTFMEVLRRFKSKTDESRKRTVRRNGHLEGTENIHPTGALL
jgi:hypothetical protein